MRATLVVVQSEHQPEPLVQIGHGLHTHRSPHQPCDAGAPRVIQTFNHTRPPAPLGTRPMLPGTEHVTIDAIFVGVHELAAVRWRNTLPQLSQTLPAAVADEIRNHLA